MPLVLCSSHFLLLRFVIFLNIASLARDGELLSEARVYAEHILDAGPTLSEERNAPLARELRKDKYRIKDYSKIS